jgi:hypothetical protein
LRKRVCAGSVSRGVRRAGSGRLLADMSCWSGFFAMRCDGICGRARLPACLAFLFSWNDLAQMRSRKLHGMVAACCRVDASILIFRIGIGRMPFSDRLSLLCFFRAGVQDPCDIHVDVGQSSAAFAWLIAQCTKLDINAASWKE